MVSSPEPFAEAVEIFYKHCVGSYAKSGQLIKEVRSLLPRDAQVLALYYDDPKEVDEQLCQSAVGCVCSGEWAGPAGGCSWREAVG